MTLGRDPDGRIDWNRRMLDFALRLGFELKLCQPYRAQTKGKVESGVKYVRGNLWPSIRFTDDADLKPADPGVVRHRWPTPGNTGQPIASAGDMLAEEQPHLGKLPEERGLAPYLRKDWTVARDGYISWEGLATGPLGLGGLHSAGGSASRHAGDLGWRPAHRHAPQGPESGATLHPARPVGRSARRR